MMPLDDAKRLIEATLRKELNGIEFVKLHEEVDFDDDVVLRAQIVFGSNNIPNPKELLSAMDSVVDALNKAEDSRFPVLSFISMDDARKAHIAAE